MAYQPNEQDNCNITLSLCEKEKAVVCRNLITYVFAQSLRGRSSPVTCTLVIAPATRTIQSASTTQSELNTGLYGDQVLQTRVVINV